MATETVEQGFVYFFANTSRNEDGSPGGTLNTSTNVITADRIVKTSVKNIDFDIVAEPKIIPKPVTPSNKMSEEPQSWIIELKQMKQSIKFSLELFNDSGGDNRLQKKNKIRFFSGSGDWDGGTNDTQEASTSSGATKYTINDMYGNFGGTCWVCWNQTEGYQLFRVKITKALIKEIPRTNRWEATVHCMKVIDKG